MRSPTPPLCIDHTVAQSTIPPHAIAMQTAASDRFVTTDQPWTLTSFILVPSRRESG